MTKTIHIYPNWLYMYEKIIHISKLIKNSSPPSFTAYFALAWLPNMHAKY